MKNHDNFPRLLQSFFSQRLMAQRRASPHTIAAYRDTFRLLLQFAQQRLHKAPSQLGLEDLDASLIGAFLDDLQKHRHNGARSRNLRLTAVRSFFAMLHWNRQHTQRSFNECLRSPANDNHVPWWLFSIVQKSMPCWRRPIGRRGWGDAIMLFFSRRCKPGCAYPR